MSRKKRKLKRVRNEFRSSSRLEVILKSGTLDNEYVQLPSLLALCTNKKIDRLPRFRR